MDEKIVQIAKSQKDYKEVKENFELDSDGKEHYYTRYGEWYGKPYEDWNIMFASFVLHYAGIKNEQIPYGHDWNEWIEDLSKKELFEPEGYAPQNGDLIFFKDQKDENVPDKEIKSYVGILVDQDKNKVIVGDLNDQVKEIVLQDKEYETMAYVHPEQEVQEVEDEKQPTEQDPVVEDGKEEPAEEEKEDKNEETKEEIEYRLPEEFKVETEDFTLTLKPRSIPGEQEEEQKEENKQPEEESKEQEETEKTTDNELQIKKFSLEPEENIQDKIDEEINRSEDELEQIQEEVKQKEEEEQNKPIPTLQIEKIDETTVESEEDQLEIQKLKEQSEKDTDPEQLLDLSFYKLRFFVEDKEINLEDQKFDAELTPKPELVEQLNSQNEFIDAAPEAEVGYYWQVIQPKMAISDKDVNSIENSENNENIKEEVFKPADLLLTSDEGILINDTYGGESIVMPLSADEPLGTITNKTPNPEFKVQIYGKLLKNKEADDNVYNLHYKLRQKQTFQVIDMSEGIPTSYGVAKFKDYAKGSDGGFILERSDKPEIIYSSTPYRYHQAPHLKYFNKLDGIDSYKLKQIWVLKDTKSEESIVEDDWIVFNEADIDSLHYTNSTEGKTKDPNNDVLYIDDQTNNKYLLINNFDPNKENNTVQETVIRLVFEEQDIDRSVDSPTKFWDYDFFEDKKNVNGTTINGVLEQNGDYVGINSQSNYSGNNTEFAFGNHDPLSIMKGSLQDLKLSEEFINKGNVKGILYETSNPPEGESQKEGSFTIPMYDENGALLRYVNRFTTAAPVFNLVGKSLTTDGKIQYNVNAPLLFTVGTAKGKSSQLEGQLSFHRIGDTHRLHSVTGPGPNGDLDNGKTINNLNKFYTRTNWSKNFYFHYNNYWPLDNYAKEKNYGSEATNNTKGKFQTIDNNGNKLKDISRATSDDGKDHNTAFGMRYDVKFDLDKYYKGPLRYFFFGDDDMWVFIDGKLVCDLGGVHQTIGAEVDIRKAYKKSTGSDLIDGEHTMTVYYLERGQSGSSCYLEYTLPKVSFDIPKSETGELQIQKEANENDPNKDYLFEVEFKDQNDKELVNDYALTVYSEITKEDGTVEKVIDEEHSNVTFHSKGQIKLKNHQYAIVKYLPLDTKFTVTEILTDEDSKKHTQVSYRDTSAGSYGILEHKEDGRYSVEGTIHEKGIISYAHFYNRIAYQLPETGGIGIEPPIMASGISVIATSGYVVILRKKGWWSKKKK